MKSSRSENTGDDLPANLNTYAEDFVVDYYAHNDTLQKPEETIYDLMKGRLPFLRMLDIGIGAGRTTLHFARSVKEYIGIDYSERMIAACKKRCPPSEYGNAVFKVCDARTMTEYGDGCFDFVLFSFNGIDNLSHAERLKIFQEVRRLCAEGGLFCFSTHNLNASSLRRVRMARNPLTMIKRALAVLSIRLAARNGQYTVILGREVGGFKLRYYAIKPKEQVRQLGEAGFHAVRIFRLKDGKEVPPEYDLDSLQDTWLYYLCSP